MRSLLLSALSIAGYLNLLCKADQVLVDTTSFDNYTVFEQSWNYLYPWGSDHNGGARMVGNSSDHSHISLSDGVLTLTATPVSGQPPSTSDPFPAIHYFSGTVYSKVQVNVDGSSAKGFQVEGSFKSPTAFGTWPAFWLTAVNGWPPEADIGEWKGTQQTWFNTFRTSSDVTSTIVAWPTDGQFHALKAVLTAVDSVNVTIDYYLDNVHQAQHTGNFVGKPMWLIIDLQMEGSSGSPGPSGTTTYQITDVKITKLT